MARIRALHPVHRQARMVFGYRFKSMMAPEILSFCIRKGLVYQNRLGQVKEEVKPFSRMLSA